MITLPVVVLGVVVVVEVAGAVVACGEVPADLGLGLVLGLAAGARPGRLRRRFRAIKSVSGSSPPAPPPTPPAVAAEDEDV